MEIEFELPTDDDGFLDRSCPVCERHFRWHADEASDDGADEVSYFCPYCGEQSPSDEWWTREQVEAMQQAAMAAAYPEIAAELLEATRGFDRTMLNVSVEADAAARPAPLELDDSLPFVTVTSPCHPDEPVKVERLDLAALHCLVCGSKYRLEL